MGKLEKEGVIDYRELWYNKRSENPRKEEKLCEKYAFKKNWSY